MLQSAALFQTNRVAAAPWPGVASEGPQGRPAGLPAASGASASRRSLGHKDSYAGWGRGPGLPGSLEIALGSTARAHEAGPDWSPTRGPQAEITAWWPAPPSAVRGLSRGTSRASERRQLHTHEGGGPGGPGQPAGRADSAQQTPDPAAHLQPGRAQGHPAPPPAPLRWLPVGWVFGVPPPTA